MKIGFSSFNFANVLKRQQVTMPDVIKWIAENGGQHIELATITFSPPDQGDVWNLDDDRDLIDSILASSRDNGLQISGVCMPADFLAPSPEKRAQQIERVKHHVRLCDELGIRFLRHDVVEWGYSASGVAAFEKDLPALVDASREIAQYAAGFGITTSVENHGFYMNASERIRRLIFEVDEKNFGTTLDVGNFLCVDEDSYAATVSNLPFATFVHLKDFYIRPRSWPLGDGWIRTPAGVRLRGSVIGYGDTPMCEIVEHIAKSSYDGFVSIEFEGIEDPFLGCGLGIKHVKKFLTLARGDEVADER